MDDGIVGKDQLGREVGESLGTGDQHGLVPDGLGGLELGEVERLQVGEAPRLIVALGHPQRLVEIPRPLLVVPEPLGPRRGM